MDFSDLRRETCSGSRRGPTDSESQVKQKGLSTGKKVLIVTAIVLALAALVVFGAELIFLPDLHGRDLQILDGLLAFLILSSTIAYLGANDIISKGVKALAELTDVIVIIMLVADVILLGVTLYAHWPLY